MLTTRKEGKYLIRMCDSLPCELNAARSILCCVESELGISRGETTPDGLFTLKVVPCLGLCDRAPGMMINQKALGPLTEESVKTILDTLREQG